MKKCEQFPFECTCPLSLPQTFLNGKYFGIFQGVLYEFLGFSIKKLCEIDAVSIIAFRNQLVFTGKDCFTLNGLVTINILSQLSTQSSSVPQTLWDFRF